MYTHTTKKLLKGSRSVLQQLCVTCFALFICVVFRHKVFFFSCNNTLQMRQQQQHYHQQPIVFPSIWILVAANLDENQIRLRISLIGHLDICKAIICDFLHISPSLGTFWKYFVCMCVSFYELQLVCYTYDRDDELVNAIMSSLWYHLISLV